MKLTADQGVPASLVALPLTLEDLIPGWKTSAPRETTPGFTISNTRIAGQPGRID